MSAAREIIAALIAGGMDPVEAAAMMARAAVEMSPIPSGKSTGAIRQQRYRERHKASQSVTPLRQDEASQSVTNRNESVTRDAVSLSIENITTNLSLEREGPSKPKASRAKPRTRLPDDWQLSERNIAYAAERGFDRPHIDSMAERFVNHHRGRGTVMADWNAAWQTWVGNEIKFNGGRNGHGVSQARTIGAAGPAATGADTILAGMGRIADRIAARKLAERQDSLDLAGDPGPQRGRS